MNANTKDEPAQERTTVPVYTNAHGSALDAINALRKQKPSIRKTLTQFASDAIIAAAEQVLSRKYRPTKP